MSCSPPAFPIEVFNTDVVEMIDCTRYLFSDPYFSTIGCVYKCSWGKNQACLLWLLIPYPQFRIKLGGLRIQSNKIRSRG